MWPQPMYDYPAGSAATCYYRLSGGSQPSAAARAQSRIESQVSLLPRRDRLASAEVHPRSVRNPRQCPECSSAERKRAQMSRKLYVGNLPYDTSEQDLQTLFASAGTVETVNVIRDMATGRPRGFAFVEMATDDDAQAAIRTFADHSLGGRNITVNEARPKAQSGSGGGGGRDRSRRSERRW
jgi:cold-inducible RNA-binding protein